MHRIDMPGHSSNFFALRNPSAGVKATQLGADWPNDVQEEICRFVESMGITLQKGNRDQLGQAIVLGSGGGVKSARKNLLANPGPRIWQRGTTFTTSAGGSLYTADRWRASAGTSGVVTVTKQAHSNGGPPDPRGGLEFLRWVQSTAGTVPFLEQRIPCLEEADAQDLVLSVYLRVSTGTLAVIPQLRQFFGSGGSATVDLAAAAWTVTTTWTRFSVKLTPASIAGKTIGAGAYLAWQLKFPSAATFTVEMTSAQLEPGALATFFERPDVAADLAECLRFYCKSYNPDVTPGTVTVDGQINCSDIGPLVEALNTRFPIPMRTTPAVTWYSPRTSNKNGFIERPQFNDAAVTGTSYNSEVSTGAPATNDPGAVVSAYAHFTADAEL